MQWTSSPLLSPLPPLFVSPSFATKCAISGAWGATGDQVEANGWLCASKEKVSYRLCDTGDDILQGQCVLYTSAS